MKTRKQINEYTDPIINLRYTPNIKDLIKDYYMKNDYSDVRNVKEDIRHLFNDLGNKTITLYKFC